MPAVGRPTPNFRTIVRDGESEDQNVVQQLFIVTMEPGSVKERTVQAWLDVEHLMFHNLESADQATLRKQIEEMGKDFTISKV